MLYNGNTLYCISKMGNRPRAEAGNTIWKTKSIENVNHSDVGADEA